MNLGKSIKELRKSKGLSQVELAKLSGVTQAALSQIERGKRPGDLTLKKLSKALKVSVSLIYVLGLEKEEVPKEKRELYDDLFPVIQSMINRIASK
jgi:transcriptional regulator with XRE-family HTH domain